MTVDIVPELLEKVNKEFLRYINNSKMFELQSKLEDGTATWQDAYKFSLEVGNARTKAFETIKGEILPDGKMYFNISDRIIRETLPSDQKMIAEYAEAVQAFQNANNGLKLKAQIAELNDAKIKGFVERLSKGELFDDIKWILKEPVKVFDQNVVDDTIQKNIEFHQRAGLKTTCTRTMKGDCCDWCKQFAGTYTGKVPAEVFMRHDHCRCTVEYNSKRLNVYVSDKGSHSFRDADRDYSNSQKKRQERDELVARNKARQEFVDKMAAQGWTKKDAAIYFNKNRLWLGG